MLDYFSLIRNNKFHEALAGFPKKLRYILPKQLWMANRLGLYQTVINQKVVLPHHRNFVVTSIAKIKRYAMSDEQATQVATKIMTAWQYHNLRKEFVKETAHLMPDFYAQFFQQHPKYFKDEYYLGLCLSIIHESIKVNFENNDVTNRQLFIKNNLPELTKSFNLACLQSNTKLINQQDKLSQLNEWLVFYQLSPIQLKDDAGYLKVENIHSEQPSNVMIDNMPLVSILVTCYNAELTIGTCIDSLLSQTWKNLEIIVVNDASQDNSADIVKKLVNDDERVIFIDLPTNIGTFSAKSIGAKYATGEYLTCQDSDDWAHPQKIEKQIIPLINNKNLIATTSSWLRIDEKGNYHARQFYPFLRQNPASPLFRRRVVEDAVGLWHMVRTGADSEFYERLKLQFGANAILNIKKPLTLASHRRDSLTNSEEFGVYSKYSAINRMNYWEAWRLWHIEQIYQSGSVRMPDIDEQILLKNVFQDIPKTIQIENQSLLHSMDNHLVFSKNLFDV